MLKSGTLYKDDGCIINFFQDRLQVYDVNLKKIIKLNVFADLVVSAFNKIAVLNGNYLEIKNFIKKELIVKIELDISEKINSMALAETILLLGRDDGVISIISMLSKKKDMQFKISNNAIDFIFFNSESIVSVLSNNEIFISNIVDRTIISKISETSIISHIVGNDEKIMYIVDNKVVIYYFKQNKRDILYTGVNIQNIFYNTNLFVLDKKKLLLINNKHKFTKIAKIKADSFIVQENKIFYTKEDKIYKTENLYLKRETDNIVRILTVDDSDTMRMILKDTILNNFKNVEVYEAKDGHNAMKMLKQHNIDVMLLDWNMPIMDGEEVVNMINELNIYPDLKIIMATTEDSTDNVRKMVNKGVNGYLIKPFSEPGTVSFTKRIIDIVLKERNV